MSVQTRGRLSGENTNIPPQEPVSPEEQRHGLLEDALTLLKNLDSTTSLRGNVRFQLAVDNLVKVAMSDGLSGDQLLALVDIINSDNPKITQTIRGKLVKCLIPSHTVPQAAIIKVLYIITANVLAGPTNLHSLLLRWVLVVFDHLDGYDRLHRHYGLVFSFLDSARLLPQACQLLFLLTRREDVVLFRVQKLLDLVRLLGPESCIMGLLMIYKVYCPHLVTIKLNYGTKSFFKNSDSVWRSTIEAVSAQREDEEVAEDVKRARKRKESAQTRKEKRQKLLVPEIHAAMQEVEEEEDLPEDGNLASRRARVPYVQIDTFTSFLQNLENIEYPSQVSAVLRDSQLQLLMACDPDPVVMTRLSIWIQHLFVFGFKRTDVESKQNEELLKMLLHFSQNVETLPVVEAFLSSYLETWDGQKYAPVIFCLISCLKPRLSNSEDFCVDILQPLLKLFYSSDVYFKVSMMSSLARLLHNWAEEFLLSQKVKAAALSDQTGSERESDAEQSLVEEKGEATHSELTGMIEIIFQLIKYLDTTLVLGLRMEGDHFLLQRAAVEVIDIMSMLYQKYKLPIVCFPSRLFYRLLLSSCPATLAALCSCINGFRMAITALRESRQHRDTSTHYTLCDTVASHPWSTGGMGGNTPGPDTPRQTVTSHRPGLDVFNAMLLDVMGMLWQGRMFIQRKRLNSSMSVDFPQPKDADVLLNPRALTIFQGPAFLGLAYKFLQEAQGTEKRSHPAQIEKFKQVYLQYLEREGFPQFRELVDANLKSRKSVTQDSEESNVRS